ncbi:MAG: sensor histidine kinase, partial [Candidatus Angelobacter sp.]
LVSRFLDFARPSQLEIRAEDLPALLESCLKTVADQGAAAKVNIVRNYASGLPKAMVDRELCEQVFTNLLLNACEAMGEGGGELKVKIQPASNDSAEQIAVEIEDSGPGVGEEMKEQIFNPFFTTKKSGVGLGLAIVSKIVDAHGGAVKLVSRREQGACFRVTLPAAEAAGARS